MTKFNKELIVQPNVGVFCKTKEESYQLREWAHSIGLQWKNKISYIDYISIVLREDTVYYLSDGSWLWEVSEGTTKIINFEDAILKELQFSVGDRVFSYSLQQWGTVSQTNANKLYPLTVKFDKFVTPTAEWFTSDGRSNSNNKAPDLFHTRVTITPIEKQEPVYEYKWIQIRNGKAFETKGYYVDQTEIPAQEPEFWNCCETYKIEGSKQERVIL